MARGISRPAAAGGHPGLAPAVDGAPPGPAYDVVVLPDEPYAFSPTDGPEAFPGVPAVCVSGRHLTWYGPSLVEARDVLTAQLQSKECSGPGNAPDRTSSA